MTRVLHAARISNVDSGMFLNSIRKKVNLELGKRNKEMFFVLSRAWKKDKKHEENKIDSCIMKQLLNSVFTYYHKY